MATVLDTLITNLRFNPDLRGLRKMETGVNRARAKLDNFASSMFRIGGVATAALTATVVAFSSFEFELAKIEGLVGISREQLDAWKDDILAISQETGQSPTELAKSLFFVTSAGLRGAAAIDVLRESAKGCCGWSG